VHTASAASLRRGLDAALSEGVTIRLGFTRRPPHVYRVLAGCGAAAGPLAEAAHSARLEPCARRFHLRCGPF
jgi:hypothetical protein